MILRHCTRNVRVVPSFLSNLRCQCHVLRNTRELRQQTGPSRSIIQRSYLNTRAFSSKSISYAATGQKVSEPAKLSTSEYHQQSDNYIDSLVECLEEFAEGNEAIDVEYHSGVLNLVFPPAGTYVINKQPPNRQIWLSSPISGPKRYDYVLDGNGKGEWIYLRDGSRLTDLLNEELKLSFEPPEDG